MSNYVPEELLTEILKRVPVKSLVSLLLVSKSWYTLITSPDFITTHLNKTRQEKSLNDSSLLLIRRYINDYREERYTIKPDEEGESGDSGRSGDFGRKSIELDFPLRSQVGYFRIVGTCDGLVCLCDDLFTIGKPIYLWNPSVRKYLELPCPPFDPPFPFMFVLGFGADLGGDHKVVRIVYDKEQLGFTLPPEVEVYSLRMGFWRRIVNVRINVFITDFVWSQAFVNGVVHWISYCRCRNKNGGTFSSLILGFDMENELFNEIILPDELSHLLATNLVVNVYRGSLAVIDYHPAENNGYCSIWVMRQYGVFESWTKLFTVNLVEAMERVVGFRKNGDVLIARGSGKLVMFDPKTNAIEELGLLGSPRSFYIHHFEETLVLLGRRNVTVEEEEQETEDDQDFQEVGGNDCDEESSRKKDDSCGQER